MIKTSTQNELIQYVYNELAEDACKQLETAFMHDDELTESCSELLELQNHLDGALKTPHERAVRNILNYSKSLSLQS
jgi:ABC-type phosphate/phosphonate transport system substrate-binding protein